LSHLISDAKIACRERFIGNNCYVDGIKEVKTYFPSIDDADLKLSAIFADRDQNGKTMDRYIIEALARCPIFHGMNAGDIEQMMKLADYRVVTISKDDVFILAGMPCRYADIIIRGEMTARMVGLSGKYVEVSRLQSGNIVAPAFIFAKDRSMPVTVETETDVEILRMMPQELTRLIDMDDRVRTNFITTLSNINVFLTHKMRMLSLLTVREKVAFFLLDTATKQKSETIHLDKSRQEIADTFGIQKFSLMRCLSEIAEAGAIAVDGKDITILDRRKMK